MANQENIHPSKVGSSGSGVSNSQTASGSPGRTPGSAEGDREVVEQDLRNKGLDTKDEKQEKKSK